KPLITPEAEANGGVKIRAGKIDSIRRSVDAQLQARMLLVQVRQARRQPLLQERGERGQVHRTGFALLPETVERGFELIEPAADAGQELRTFRCELDAPAVAPEERYAEVILQRADLLADGRRRHVQRLRGFTEIEPRGDCFEDAQRVERQSVVSQRSLQGFLNRGSHFRFVREANPEEIARS